VFTAWDSARTITTLLKRENVRSFIIFRLNFKREVLRELRGIIAFREEIISVIKRYEKQATAKKVVTASVKSTKLVSKGFNYESQA
jgi:hypothetical protein